MKYDFASEERLDLCPPPVWDRVKPEDARKDVREMVQQVATETKRLMKAGKRKPVGARRIRRQNPHSMPKSFKKSPAPRFHASSRQVRRSLEEGYRSFDLLYRQASEDLRRSKLGVKFPENCFPPSLPFARGPTTAVLA